jgi:hypothetical protein
MKTKEGTCKNQHRFFNRSCPFKSNISREKQRFYSSPDGMPGEVFFCCNNQRFFTFNPKFDLNENDAYPPSLPVCRNYPIRPNRKRISPAHHIVLINPKPSVTKAVVIGIPFPAFQAWEQRWMPPYKDYSKE